MAPGWLLDQVVQGLENSNSGGIFKTLTGGASRIYKWPDMITAVREMGSRGVGSVKLWVGEYDNFAYGLVNIAAFLAQCMQETIQYDACDENNWSDPAVVAEVGGTSYSSVSACGQLGQHYQDYKCSPDEDELAGGQMACDVDPNMEFRASTQASWYGAPPRMFCAPRSRIPKAPRWDYNPWCGPGTSPFPDDVDLTTYFEYVNKAGTNASQCRDYRGQKAGGWSFDGCRAEGCQGAPAPLFCQPDGRTDLEGCCWWGRGVIQTTGVCNFGKLNFYLGKRAADEGRDALFPQVDFCTRPDSICAEDSPPELKWVAGFFYWLNSVQPYSRGGWDYFSRLTAWVDNGMDAADVGFIDGASGIVNRGCHNPPNCGTGEIHGLDARRANFRQVLNAMGLR